MCNFSIIIIIITVSVLLLLILIIKVYDSDCRSVLRWISLWGSPTKEGKDEMG